MGNSYLRDLCEIDKIDEDKIKGCKCVVDGHNWLYKYMTITAEYNNVRDFKKDGERHPELIGIPMGISKIVEYNIKPVFVFDGGYDNLKQKELDKRRKSKEKAKKDEKEAKDDIEKAKYRARQQKVTDKTLDIATDILDLFNISYMSAPKSAESQAAYMCKEEENLEYVISDDYDTIIFGSPFTLRNFTSSSRPSESISLKETLDELDITYQELVNAYILCGTDYNEGVDGIGPVTSIKYTKQYNTMEELFEDKGINVENYETIYNLFTNPEVKEDYNLPTDIDYSTDKLRSYLPENTLQNRNVKNSIEKIEKESKKTSLGDF